MWWQALNGLAETGTVDEAMWEKLLGPDYKSIAAPYEVHVQKVSFLFDLLSIEKILPLLSLRVIGCLTDADDLPFSHFTEILCNGDISL